MMKSDPVQTRKLTEIIPGDLFVGTSLIIRQGDRFLYGIRPEKHTSGRKILEITGIGGGLEDEDESLSAGVIREAQEEINCNVDLISSPRTLIVRGQNQVEWVVIQGHERPAALVFRNYRTPPHHPWHPDHQGEACLVVFAAELKRQPRPVMELPYLIRLNPEHILETARRDVSLGDLLGTGAELITGSSPAPPESSWVRLTDSQEALAIALGEDTPSFYRSL